ncbi:MAG: ribbon-helix-helix domain-containing protein [Cohaesibacteraceae bacterium]
MLVKRSVTLSGHSTSIALERPFWDEVDRIAAERGQSRAGLIATIDRERDPENNLASALRLLVLDELTKARLSDDS